MRSEKHQMSVNTAVQPNLAADIISRRARSLSYDAWRRLLSSWNGRVGLVLITFTILVGLLAPVIDPYDPSIDSNLAMARKPPSLQHPFGADRLGRDILRRVIHGTRVSLLIG